MGRWRSSEDAWTHTKGMGQCCWRNRPAGAAAGTVIVAGPWPFHLHTDTCSAPSGKAATDAADADADELDGIVADVPAPAGESAPADAPAAADGGPAAAAHTSRHNAHRTHRQGTRSPHN